MEPDRHLPRLRRRPRRGRLVSPRVALFLIALAATVATWTAIHDVEAFTEVIAIGLIIAIKRSTLP